MKTRRSWAARKEVKEAAMEIEFEEKKHLIVPHSAILALLRTELAEDGETA